MLHALVQERVKQQGVAIGTMAHLLALQGLLKQKHLTELVARTCLVLGHKHMQHEGIHGWLVMWHRGWWMHSISRWWWGHCVTSWGWGWTFPITWRWSGWTLAITWRWWWWISCRGYSKKRPQADQRDHLQKEEEAGSRRMLLGLKSTVDLLQEYC